MWVETCAYTCDAGRLWLGTEVVVSLGQEGLGVDQGSEKTTVHVAIA